MSCYSFCLPTPSSVRLPLVIFDPCTRSESSARRVRPSKYRTWGRIFDEHFQQTESEGFDVGASAFRLLKPFRGALHDLRSWRHPSRGLARTRAIELAGSFGFDPTLRARYLRAGSRWCKEYALAHHLRHSICG